MVFHNVACVCFVALLAPKIETNAQLDSKTSNITEPEVLFADVIKNISRVNIELQNLVKNYEKFKNTHASQEDFANVKITYASDSDGGRVNRNSKTNKRNPSDERTTNPNPTEMIFLEEETENSSETDNSSEAKTSSQKQKSDEIHASHEEYSKKLPVETTEKVQTTTEPDISNKVLTDALPNKEGTEPANDEFDAIHNNLKIKRDRLKRILSEAHQEPDQTKHTENEKKTKYVGGDTPKKSSESELSTEVKPHSEEKKELKRAFDENRVAVTSAIFLRSQLKVNTTITTKEPKNGSLGSDSDENLSKEVFQANVLRKAYGDACTKLVIKKCHKACKSASKVACRAAMKCKEEFKTYFKDKSKSGCIDAFQLDSLRRNTDPKINEEDITQEEYLSFACQTPIRRNLDQLPVSNPADNNTESINILRDKYERACARISKKKCTKACHNALDSSCGKYECQKTLKKYFKKHCKTQCKRFYSGTVKSNSSSDDSDYDSDSDDSSDDDDDDSDSDSSDDDDDDDQKKKDKDKDKDKDKEKDKDRKRKVLKT